MTNDFDEELTVTLRERADAVPHRSDLAGPAIRQAHGIRRRRRIAGGVAAAALVAVGVPVGLQVGDALPRGGQPIPPATQGPDDSEITPSRVSVQLADLPAGPAPSIPYVDGSELLVDGQSIDLGADAADIGRVAYADGTAYYALRAEDGTLTLLEASPDDDGRGWSYGGGRSIDAGPWASPDGQYVALLADGALEVRNTTDGTVSSVPVGGANDLQSLTFAGDELFFLAGKGGTLMRWTIGADAATAVDDVTRATAISPDGELVADQHEIDNLKARACTQMKSLSTSEVLWETCEFRVLGFSPDGRYAWGARAYADAYDTYAVVLDARTGRQLMRVDGPDPQSNPMVLFTHNLFESDTTLLLSLEQGESAALVRCDLANGDCERATELAGVVPYENGSPYRLLS